MTTTIIITAVLAGAAGVLAQAYRSSKAHGVTLWQSLRATQRAGSGGDAG